MCASVIPFIPSLKDQINFLSLYLFFVYKFQIKLTLSVVTDAILAFFNHPVARKDLKFKRTKLPFALLTDRCANSLKAFDLHREDCSRK